VDISKTAVNQIEIGGATDPPLSRIRALTAMLGVRMDSLASRKDEDVELLAAVASSHGCGKHHGRYSGREGTLGQRGGSLAKTEEKPMPIYRVTLKEPATPHEPFLIRAPLARVAHRTAAYM
jgi:hypothetical protein